MLLQNNTSFFYYLFFDGDFNFLWLIIAIELSVLGVFFTRKALNYKNDNMESAYQLHLGLGIFFLFYTITRISFIISNYYSVYVNEDVLEFQIAIRVAYCTALFSLSFFFYGLERSFLPTKGLAMAFPLIMGILSIFLPYDLMRTINYVLMPLYMVFGLSSYVYIAAKTTGAVRKNALISLIGLILFFLGIYLDSKMFKTIFTNAGVRWVAFLIPPPIFIIGITLFYWASTRKISE